MNETQRVCIWALADALSRLMQAPKPLDAEWVSDVKCTCAALQMYANELK